MIKYSEYARKCSSNRVYPLSIVEGFQDGEIIPDVEMNSDVELDSDGEDNTNAVLFWHYAGFAYLSGDISESFLEKIYQRFYQEEPDRRFFPWERNLCGHTLPQMMAQNILRLVQGLLRAG